MTGRLWDKSGAPDPEIEELERVLAPLALRATIAPPELFVRCKEAAAAPASRRWWRKPLVWAVVAATCAAMAIAAMIIVPAWNAGGRLTSWSVTEVGGSVALGRSAATMAARIKIGQPIRTGAGAHATIEADEYGQVEVKPDSEMAIVETGEHAQRMALRHGRIHALIWAPPREFVVDTPSSKAIDLGCQYDLTVDNAGNGFLEVETGWVAFQFKGRESFIPAGAACRTTRANGPGIPFFEDSSPGLRNALERFESAGGHNALREVLNDSGEHDGLTLWHLLTRVDDADRGAVFDRLATVVKLPATVSRPKVLARDRATLDACWDALNLDSAEWWREWKRDWH